MLKEDNNVIREEFFSPKLVPFKNKNLYQGFVVQSFPRISFFFDKNSSRDNCMTFELSQKDRHTTVDSCKLYFQLLVGITFPLSSLRYLVVTFEFIPIVRKAKLSNFKFRQLVQVYRRSLIIGMTRSKKSSNRNPNNCGTTYYHQNRNPDNGGIATIDGIVLYCEITVIKIPIIEDPCTYLDKYQEMVHIHRASATSLAQCLQIDSLVSNTNSLNKYVDRLVIEVQLII